MTFENVDVSGKPVRTLRELLCPGLRAVVLGLNPSPTSVAAGHYWQGQHGQRLWQLLTGYGLLSGLPRGKEDQAAFKQGLGFADVVRRPTSSSEELGGNELRTAIPGLLRRLSVCPGVLVLCRYKKVADVAAEHLRRVGHDVLTLPSPYAKKEIEVAMMQEIIPKMLAVRDAGRQ